MYEPMYHGYSQSRSSGRPSLQSIGKSKMTVDEDEPPDVPLQAYGFEELHDHSFSSVESVFEASDAEDACKLLRKAFHMLGPGRHACKRNPDHGGSHFVHCRRGVRLGGYYSQLRRLLEERALLELVRDCMYRVRSAQLFVEELEGLLNAEYRTAYAIRHGCLLEAPVSKLYCLNALCEDLRVHAGHWNSIKHRTNTNRWLQPVLGFLCQELRAVQRTLVTLCDRAIFIVDRMVHVGFEVLAHCDLDSLTPDILWNITRGLEDFNNIVATYRMLSAAEGVYSDHFWPQNGHSLINPALLGIPSPQSYSCVYLHPALANASGRLSDSIKSIPFPKVLGILANERSRYAAQLTHKFFTANEAFTLALRTAPLHPPYEWEEDLVSTVSGIHLHSRALSLDAGDFHASHASLNAALLQIGSLKVPDLSSLPSPLVEFSQKEQHFADSFLQIVCTSTSLLRKNEHNNSKAKSKQKTDFKVPLSPVVGRPPKVQGDTPVLSRSDSRRKTVSWGDNADSSIRTQVVAMYMNVLWQHFGRNLDLFLDEPAWADKVGLLQTEVGSVFMHGDTVNAMLRHMIEHICMKDMFPPGSVSPLLGVVVRLHALSAFAAWDSYMTRASSSQTDDKCYPSLLSEGQYSTRSGRLLRDAHRPLLSLLHEVCRNMGQMHSGGAKQLWLSPERAAQAEVSGQTSSEETVASEDMINSAVGTLKEEVDNLFKDRISDKLIPSKAVQNTPDFSSVNPCELGAPSPELNGGHSVSQAFKGNTQPSDTSSVSDRDTSTQHHIAKKSTDLLSGQDLAEYFALKENTESNTLPKILNIPEHLTDTVNAGESVTEQPAVSQAPKELSLEASAVLKKPAELPEVSDSDTGRSVDLEASATPPKLPVFAKLPFRSSKISPLPADFRLPPVSASGPHTEFFAAAAPLKSADSSAHVDGVSGVLLQTEEDAANKKSHSKPATVLRKAVKWAAELSSVLPVLSNQPLALPGKPVGITKQSSHTLAAAAQNPKGILKQPRLALEKLPELPSFPSGTLQPATTFQKLPDIPDHPQGTLKTSQAQHMSTTNMDRGATWQTSAADPLDEFDKLLATLDDTSQAPNETPHARLSSTVVGNSEIGASVDAKTWPGMDIQAVLTGDSSSIPSRKVPDFEEVRHFSGGNTGSPVPDVSASCQPLGAGKGTTMPESHVKNRSKEGSQTEDAGLSSETQDDQPVEVPGLVWKAPFTAADVLAFPLTGGLESVELIPPYDLDLSLVSGISARLLTTCQASCTWCSNKLHHFLSSWHVQSYLFLAYTDLRILSDYSQRASSLLQMLATNPPAPPSSLLDQLALSQLSEAQQQASTISTQMQNLESSCLGHFTEKFSHHAASFFQENLPPVKCWRRKVAPEFPEDASSYVQQMWDYLLYPVTEGVAKLPREHQLTALTATVNALCGAWTSAFLKEKTKFSLFGAQQLGVDFDTLRAKLSDALHVAEVRRGVMELPVFRQLSGIVQLLKRQPQRRPNSRFRDCSTEDLSCETADRNPSPSASRSELPANMEEQQDANDISYVPNPEEWLALRVIGGTRSWRFPSCFGANGGQR